MDACSPPSHIVVEAKQGQATRPVKIDVIDYLRLAGRKLSIASHGYAQTFANGRVTVLHRWILGLQVGDKRIGDHVNGDKLDNRRANLRIVDPSGSSQNVAGRGMSPHRGVHPTRNGKWSARVKFQRVTYYLGTFEDEIDAARAAEAKRIELMPFYVPATQRVRHVPGPSGRIRRESA